MLTLRHVGIVVEDLRRALNFWEAAGFRLRLFHVKPFSEDYFEQRLGAVEEGPELDAALELRRARLRTVKLFDSAGQCIELVKYIRPYWGGDNHKAPRPYTQGITHIALTTPDIDASVRDLTAAGAFFHGPPQRMDEHTRMVYCRGPEGILLELVEKA